MKSESEAGSIDPQDMQRLAMQIALQLPRNNAQALTVLGYLRDVVKWQAGIAYTWHDDTGISSGFEAAEVVPFPKRA